MAEPRSRRHWVLFRISAIVVGIAALAGFVFFGVQGLLIDTGRLGSPGKVAVTQCRAGRPEVCHGTFTPADPLASPRSGVHVEIRPLADDVRVGGVLDARLVDGDAWPTAGLTRLLDLLFILFGLAFGGFSITLALLSLNPRWRSAEEARAERARQAERYHWF
jgi:hypothetical protein